MPVGPHLSAGNARELLEAATHQPKSEIEQLIARRFPRTEMLGLVQAIPAASRSAGQLAPGQVETLVQGRTGDDAGQLSPGTVEAQVPRAKLTPIASQRFALQLTIGQSTHDKLRYAQELLSHQVPSGDMADVLDRALDALIGQLEKRKFAATTRPRPSPLRPSAGRHVPADVKRTVWERDGAQCAFVSDTGHRCPARTRLEFDHADPVARGGEATAERIRLRCRAHNQYAAECTFGVGFMNDKRQAARCAAAGKRAAAEKRATAESAAAAERSREGDVVPWLRQLGFRADEARAAAARCETIPDAPLEERVRFALSVLGARHRRLENSLETAT